nr:hypothetical protein [Glycomyces paridis]
MDVPVGHHVRLGTGAGGLGVGEHAEELGLVVVEEDPVVDAPRGGVEDPDAAAAQGEVV